MKPRRRTATGPPVIPRELRELEANAPDPNTGDQGPDGMPGVLRVMAWLREVDGWYTDLGIDTDWYPGGLDGWSGLPWVLHPKPGHAIPHPGMGDVIPHPRRGKRAGER